MLNGDASLLAQPPPGVADAMQQPTLCEVSGKLRDCATGPDIAPLFSRVMISGMGLPILRDDNASRVSLLGFDAHHILPLLRTFVPSWQL